MAALERGGTFIDKSREPVFWADYHEQVAETHLDHGHWARAEELVDEIIDIREEHQPEQPTLANALLLWCRLLGSEADYSGMASVAARAERIFGDQVPPELLGVAAAVSSRATALTALGHFAEAEPLHRRALAIREATLGADHPDTAVSLSNLAALLQARGELSEAEPLHRRALAIREATLGRDHPHTAASLNNLASPLRAQGKLSEADEDD